MKYCRVSVATVLEEDPLLTGFDNSKIVFTDITYGVEGDILKVNINLYVVELTRYLSLFLRIR